MRTKQAKMNIGVPLYFVIKGAVHDCMDTGTAESAHYCNMEVVGSSHRHAIDKTKGMVHDSISSELENRMNIGHLERGSVHSDLIIEGDSCNALGKKF